MTEVNYILTTMTDQSLIIIDELCRSTSVEEGTAIAMLLCDQLARSKAYAFITTHFTLLTKLAELFFNIKVWQLQTIPRGDPANPKDMRLDFKFKLMSGAITLRGYGIYMVRGIWPEHVVRHVDELQEQLVQKTKDPKFPSLDRRVRLKYDLNCKVQKLKLQKKFTIANLREHLDQYNTEMEKIGAQGLAHSQNVLLDLQKSTNEEYIQDEGLNHSVFDASGIDQLSNEELSRMFLEDFDDIPDNASYMEDGSERTQKEAPILFSPLTSQASIQTSVSPTKAKERMLEVFSPGTKLDLSSSTSIASHFTDFEPEVYMTSSASLCSLNLTEEALELDPNRPPISESPFVTDFSRALQDDSRKTSTPVIRKMTYDARNFDTSPSSATSTISKRGLESIRHVTTSKITFTVPSDAGDLDIASVAEDLESFAEEITKEIELDYDERKAQEKKHVFPIVNIIQGPSAPSSEEDIQTGSEIIIRPIVKNLQPKTDQNQDHLNRDITMIDALNSLSNPKNHLSQQVDHAQSTQHEIHQNLHPDQQENHSSAMIEAFNSLSNPKNHLSQQVDHTQSTQHEIHQNLHPDRQKNYDSAMTETFNSLSNPKNHLSQQEDHTQSTQELNNNLQDEIHQNLHPDQQEIHDSAMIEAFNSLSNPKNHQLEEGLALKARDLEKEIDLTTEAFKRLLAEHQSQLGGSGKPEENHVEKDNEQISAEESNQHIIDIMIETFTSPSNAATTAVIQPGIEAANEENDTKDSLKNTEKEIVTGGPTVMNDSKNTVLNIAKEATGKNEQTSDEDNYFTADSSGDLSYSPLVPDTDIYSSRSSNNIADKIWNLEDIRNTNRNCDKAEPNENTRESHVCPSLSVSTELKHSDANKTDFDRTTEKCLSLESVDNIETEKCIKKVSQNEPEVKITTNTQGKRKSDTKQEKTFFKKLKTTPDKSAHDSSHSTEIKEKTTSISEASKLRNLEDVLSSTSSGTKLDNPTTSLTSLSEASRKRNLDNGGVSTSSKESEIKSQLKKRKKKQFTTPLKKHLSRSSDSTPKTTSDQSKTKFVYPSKLSQKAIREAFLEQDKKFFASSESSEDFTRMWEERLKRPARPTPRQIQQTECLATLRKTDAGVQIIPPEKKKTRAQKNHPSIDLTNRSAVNMNIFSDQNAEAFDQFIKSDIKDYKSFNFKFGRDKTEMGNMFDFKQATTVSSEYTQNSQSWTFVRKRSEEMVSQLNTTVSFLPFLSPNKDFSLTPEGFCKQNKEDITGLLRKYK